jgi:hypothetical protein
MRNTVYEKVKKFKAKYPMTLSWRLKKHCKVIEDHLNPGEVVKYAFTAQKNESTLDILTTNVIALTNKRILLGQKRLLWGYFYTAITPDMFNDLKISMGMIWGKVHIDTVRELVTLSNIQKSALPEIETCVTEYMMVEKKKYNNSPN